MLSGAEHNDGATEVAPTVAPALIIVPASFGAESDPQMLTDEHGFFSSSVYICDICDICG
jgi:hypothetical protein